jgi:hypothetical protein
LNDRRRKRFAVNVEFINAFFLPDGRRFAQWTSCEFHIQPHNADKPQPNRFLSKQLFLKNKCPTDR